MSSIIYSAHLYSVEQNHVRAFILAFRDGGTWHDLARRCFPGYIATSVLQCQACSSQRLVIHFWITEEANARAERSPTMTALKELVHRLTRDSHDLGVFAFEPSLEKDHRVLDSFRSMTAHFAGEPANGPFLFNRTGDSRHYPRTAPAVPSNIWEGP
jgi:hypothetical protein